MEIFILYKFYIFFIFKTYFKKRKSCAPNRNCKPPARARRVLLRAQQRWRPGEPGTGWRDSLWLSMSPLVQRGLSFPPQYCDGSRPCSRALRGLQSSPRAASTFFTEIAEQLSILLNSVSVCKRLIEDYIFCF